MDGKLSRQLCCTMGHLGAFSLNEFKHISTGDGGAVVTDDDELGAKARMFADKYMDRIENVRESPMLAPNYRMTELQGAVAVAQLRKVFDICERRTDVGDRISASIHDIAGILPPQVPEGGKHVYWHYMLRVDENELGTSRDEFAKALNAEGIPVQRVIFRPVSMSIHCSKTSKSIRIQSTPWNHKTSIKRIPTRRGCVPKLRRF